MTNNKFGAKSLFYSPSTQLTYQARLLPDCLFFASQWEFQVYQVLTSTLTIPSECLIMQSEQLIKPATKKYPAMHWKCDFEIHKTEKYPFIPHLLIEAKGVPTPQFKRDLQFFELHNSDNFNKLLIVGNHAPERIDKRIRTITVNDLIFCVRSMIAQNISQLQDAR